MYIYCTCVVLFISSCQVSEGLRMEFHTTSNVYSCKVVPGLLIANLFSQLFN